VKNWIVGQTYKDSRGSSYTYIGPFTNKEGEKCLAFLLAFLGDKSEILAHSICQRKEDGKGWNPYCREYDILHPDDITTEEREFIARICDAIKLNFSATTVRQGGKIPVYGADEKLLSIIRELRSK
jgi:hypothetical protein